MGGVRRAYIIGDPVAHSLSPALHNAAFQAAGLEAEFLARQVDSSELEKTLCEMRDENAIGASVTVPHKRAVLDLCDRVSPVAREVGAVNCLVFRDGQISGYNTDVGGYIDSLTIDANVEVGGRNAVLLGSGGAARAVWVGLRQAGAASITVVARTPEKTKWTAALPWQAEGLAELLPTCDLLVDCTSAGLSAKTEHALPAPIELDLLPPTAVVSSLIYHRTPALLRQADERGLSTCSGFGMLLYQGTRAFEHWTEQKAPVETMRKALADATAAS